MKPQLSVFSYSLTNQADDAVDVHIDGYIVDSPTQELMREYWGDETSVSFKSFRNQIEGARPKVINLFINSGGGHVGDAMAMHDYLKDKETAGVKVNRKGRGIIASAATYLLMGDNSEMSENSWFMIHNVQGAVWGDVNVVENYAKTMRKFNNAIRDFYARITNQEPEQISALMNKESWLTATEAKEKGFVKNITGQASFSNAIKPEHWQFNNTTVLNAYNSFTQSNNVQMDTKKITDAIQNGFNGLMEKLGLKDKTGDDNVKNAFTEFSNSIVNALKDVSAPDKESVQKLVNEAIAESMKNLASNEAFKNAITEATKDAVTKDDLKKATENSITKDDLKKELENFTKSIIENIGGASGGGGKKKEQENGQRRTTPKNRFSGAAYWND